MPIQINNLKANGADLFDDSESYLYELSNEDSLMSIYGGGRWPRITTAAGFIGTLVAISIVELIMYSGEHGC